MARVEPVQYLFPEQVTLTAGKSTPVELHFRIEPGLHINSHTPRDRYLIPTSLSVPVDSGVRLASAVYPAGKDFALSLDPSTRLSVYTGEFVIRAHLIAPRGDHLLRARLRYQACNDRQCMPPRTITVPIDIIGR